MPVRFTAHHSISRHRIGRGLPSLTCAMVVLAGLQVTAASAQIPGAVAVTSASSAAAATTQQGPQTATAQAAATGRPVVIDSQTTETTQVAALPDGTYQLTSSVRPSRVRRGSTWVPVDATLTSRSGGRLAPVASTADISFSPGGTGPLVTTTAANGGSISYVWPTALPAPSLSGDTATYANVLPDVDLQLHAQIDGYSETLIVKTAAAASNPALAALSLGVHTKGLRLSKNRGGGIDANNPDGTPSLHGGSPIMWDSSIDPKVGPTPTSQNPGGATTTVLPNTLTPRSISDATLTLTPPASALTGPGVTYPLYIDPQLTKGAQHWEFVFSNGWTDYDFTNNDLKVGLCAFDGCNNIGTGRSYFTIDTHQLWGPPTTAKILDAKVYVTQIHSAVECQSEPVDLMSTSTGFNASTTFPGPSTGVLDEKVSNAGISCPNYQANNIIFSSTTLNNIFQAAATAHYTAVNLGLKSPNEADSNQWKRFAIDSTGSNPTPQAVITYSFPPSNVQTQGIWTSGAFNCNGTNYVPNSHPTLRGSAQDNNTLDPQPVALIFDVFHAGGSTPIVSTPDNAIRGGSNAILPWTVTTALADGNYEFQVRAHSAGVDQLWAAAPSGRYPFTVDTVGPSTTPTIASEDYPLASYWGAPPGGTINIGTGGATNVAGYSYGWDSTANIAALSPSTCSYNSTNSGGGFKASAGATTPITTAGLSTGPHTLYVRSFDAAHNFSAGTASFSFYVAPNFGVTNTRTELETQVSTTPTGAVLSKNPSDGTYVGLNSERYQESLPGTSGGEVAHLLATGALSLTNTDGTISQYGPKFTFNFTTSIEADYALGAMLIKANHFGQFQFSVQTGSASVTLADPNDANHAPFTFDAYTGGYQRVYQPLGGLHLSAGTHTFTMQAVGKSASSVDYVDHGYHDYGYSGGVDYFQAIPIANVQTSSFTAARNNDGIAPDFAGADIGPSSSNAYISENALRAVTGYNGTTNQLTAANSSVAFPMPASYAGVDNVVAMGQTVPLPGGPVSANNIEILATSACGAINKAPTINITLNYSNGVTTTADQVPTVPDWTSAAPTQAQLDSYATPSASGQNTISVAATLPYLIAGGAKNTHPINLYRITLINPWAGIYQISSITLPVLGTDLTKNCTKAGLHIFAIATS